MLMIRSFLSFPPIPRIRRSAEILKYRSFFNWKLKATLKICQIIRFEYLRCKEPYIYDVRAEAGWGSFETWHVIADSIVLKL